MNLFLERRKNYLFKKKTILIQFKFNNYFLILNGFFMIYAINAETIKKLKSFENRLYL